MPAFSFTAPRVTPEMELAERESLPDHVWTTIQNDLYGLDAPSNEIVPGCSSSVCSGGPQQPECPPIPDGAIDQLYLEMSQLPLTQSQDYMDAKANVPDLVEQESAAEAFLRCEKFDCQAAAKRLAYYWRIRRKLFGPHRAYLPMTLENNGALADDRKLLDSGFLSVHPNDERGRTVLAIDRIKVVPPFATRDAALRCLFFMVHLLLSEDPSIRIKGCVCLVNIKGFDLYRHFDRIMSKHIAIILFHCMPMKCKGIHLLTGRTDKGVMSLVLPSMKQVMGRDCRLHMTVHSGTDRKMLETLKPFGITSRSVSETLGGDFTPDDFAKWWSTKRGDTVPWPETTKPVTKQHDAFVSNGKEGTPNRKRQIHQERLKTQDMISYWSHRIPFPALKNGDGTGKIVMD